MEERQTERWNRERRDVVEVPGLSRRSETLLAKLDALRPPEKPKFLEGLSNTPEGRRALGEAKEIARALERRFGSADPRHLVRHTMRVDPQTTASLNRISQIARIAVGTQRAELSRQYELKRSLSKGLGL